MTKTTTVEKSHDQFGLRWIGNPFDHVCKYPVLERVPYNAETKAQIKAKAKIAAAWAETFTLGEFPATPTLLLGFDVSAGYLDHARYLPTGDDKPTGLKWRRVQHQYGGCACLQKYMVCTRLKPRADFYRHLTEVVRVPGSGHCLPQAVEYDRIVRRYRKRGNKTLRLSCEYSFLDFDEALYPIELSDLVSNLCNLVDDRVPTDMAGWEALIDRRSGNADKLGAFANLWRCPTRLKLWAVTENSD